MVAGQPEAATGPTEGLLDGPSRASDGELTASIAAVEDYLTARPSVRLAKVEVSATSETPTGRAGGSFRAPVRRRSKPMQRGAGFPPPLGQENLTSSLHRQSPKRSQSAITGSDACRRGRKDGGLAQVRLLGATAQSGWVKVSAALLNPSGEANSPP